MTTSVPSAARREPFQVTGRIDPDEQLDESPRQAFVSRLQACRERRGLTLDEIAARTKIRRSYLASLESNDLSAWPGGIYRRAYIRSYALALGLRPDTIVEEFSAAFQDLGDDADPRPRAFEGSASLRLTLVLDPAARQRSRVRRVVFVVLEAVVLALAGVVLSIGSGIVLTGLVPFVYYPLCLAIAGRTLSTRAAEGVATRGPRHTSRGRRAR